jgi:hypothetical protein
MAAPLDGRSPSALGPPSPQQRLQQRLTLAWDSVIAWYSAMA